ncbi:unnamed protein product [marine sediment metagenome]|uniref:Uncharacterized protein n=1 Tax=marine sediment metagenome TaxID=412755 RepID=X0TED5_9ZZZZ
MKVHDFKVSGGAEIIDGKSNWPDCFNLSIPDFHAWELVHSLLVQLRRGEKNIEHGFCGKLEYDIDEEG